MRETNEMTYCMRHTGEALFCCRECKNKEEMQTHVVKKNGRTYCNKYFDPVQAYLVKNDETYVYVGEKND